MLTDYLETLQGLRDTLTSLQLKIVKAQEEELKVYTTDPLPNEHKLISLKFGRRTGASTWALKYASRNDDVIIICSDVCRAELLYHYLPVDKIMVVPPCRPKLRKIDYDLLANKVVILDCYSSIPQFLTDLTCKLLIVI